MNISDKKIKQQLIAKRKIIKNKFDLIKHGMIVQERIFSPITKHLKNIESKLEDPRKKGNKTVKADDDAADADYEDTNHSLYDIKTEELPVIGSEQSNMLYTETPQQKRLKKLNIPSITELGSKRSIINETLSGENESEDEYEKAQSAAAAASKLAETSLIDYLDQYEPLPRKYIHDMVTDENNEFDHKYGIRHDQVTEKFYIGDSILHIDGSDIVVKGKKYKGTQGLYELLFKKRPENYTLNDEKTYKKIVIKTNANRRYYKNTNQIDGSKLAKYKEIIAPISGKGLFMEVTDKPIEYIHWDDPNELVARLRLLTASEKAGHTGHRNEINSIIEELSEAGIIV